MTWNTTAEPEKFDEAYDYFANKFPVTEELAEQLGQYAGPRAWTVAGVAQLDIVLDVHRSLLKAIEQGTPLDEWKEAIEEKLTKAWGKKNSPRVETIFRNASQQSFNAGRWRQMSDPAIAELRPYAEFDAIDDERTSEFCHEWDDTILLREEFAKRNACPQCHHRCRSQLRAVSEREAQRRGITETPPDTKPDAGWGKAPTEAEFTPDPADYPPELFNEYRRKRDEIEDKAKRPKIKLKKKTA